MILNLENIEKSFSSYYFSKFNTSVSIKMKRMTIRNVDGDFPINILSIIFRAVSKMTPLRFELRVGRSHLSHSSIGDLNFSIRETLLFWVDFDEGVIGVLGIEKRQITFQEVTEEDLLFQISERTKTY